MSQRIAPSERVQQEMNAFLQEGIQSSEQPLSQFIRLAVQNVVQQAVEQELTDFLGRERYERKPSRWAIAMVTNRDTFAVPRVKSRCKHSIE